MSTRKELTPLAIAISVALVASLGSVSVASADSSPFAAQSLTSGYMAASMGEGSCGGDKGKEGSCGGDKGEEGSCGGDKGEEGSCGGDKGEEGEEGEGEGGEGEGEEKGEEGKCGEGKCGGTV